MVANDRKSLKTVGRIAEADCSCLDNIGIKHDFPFINIR